MATEQDVSSPKLILPQLLFSQTHAIGRVLYLIRPEIDVAVQSTEEISVSKRRTEELSVLSSGERIVSTARSNCPIPMGVDGVLLIKSEGSRRWLFHQLLDDFEDDLKTNGLKKISGRSFSIWQEKVRFQAERLNSRKKVIQEGLRPPQIGALHSIGAHWSLHQHAATIVMPTGTGKTETMLATLAAFTNGTMLVVVPTGPLKRQTMRKFLNFGLLRKLGVLPEDIPNPIVGVINKRPRTAADLKPFENCHVVVSTMSAMAQGTAVPLASDIAEIAEILVVDEAHHIAAKSWSTFREAFKKNKILQFTATPFRRDGELVDGDVIYSYPLRRDQLDGYFRPISFSPVHEIDPEEEDSAVAKQAINQLKEDLTAGWNHLLMARCKTIDRATEVHKIYSKLAPEYSPVLVHSEDSDSATNLEKLRAMDSRIVVCVDMLGEGFDLPELKIAAVHDTHKSLAVLLQFTGRFTRSSGENIGDATIIANIADQRVSMALERLYSEDADWNHLLSEFSSTAIKEHNELIEFLNSSERLAGDDSEEVTQISNQLLRPKFSAVIYQCSSFRPKNFHKALGKNTSVHSVWLHKETNTLYFVTCSEPPVGWTRSKEIHDRQWDLFVVHYNEDQKLLYINSTDKSSIHEGLAKAVGGKSVQPIRGDTVFRTLGKINRLIFQNIGVRKIGRRNLRYAKYTGADVKQALSMTQTSGSVKSDLAGTGFEGGGPITIGCSIKGRIWSKRNDTVRRFVDWCEGVGEKINDNSIDTTKILENVLIPDEVDAFPESMVLTMDWPMEILKQSEERVKIVTPEEESTVAMFELEPANRTPTKNKLTFTVASDDENAAFELVLGGTRGFEVKQTSGSSWNIRIGRIETTLEAYLSDYPPLIRFADMSELDGNLLVHPQESRELIIPSERFEPWDWTGVNIKTESIWKGKNQRKNSIQGHVSKYYLNAGFEVIFDDDSKGEAADLVCMKEEENAVRLALLHCKFSGSDDSGRRLSDVVEVCSQAVRSAKWNWRFRELCRHLLSREKRLKKPHRPTRFIAGDAKKLNHFLRLSRFKDLRVEIAIVQPGISQKNCTAEQSAVLAAADSFLVETVDTPLTIVCSD